jgi:N-acyl homoserine lactone hydrolase
MRSTNLSRLLNPGLLAVTLLVLVSGLAACGNYYHQAKLETTPPDAAFVPAEGAGQVDALFHLLTGWSRSNEEHTFAGGDPNIESVIPLPAFLIEHNGRYALVDTGMPPQLATDPSLYLGKTVAWLAEDQLSRVIVEPDWSVPARLKAMNIDVAKLDHVILTHAHFDHTGANRAFLNAEFVATAALFKAGRDGGLFSGYWAEDFPEPMKTRVVDFSGTPSFLTFSGSVDLYGDGSVVLVPLPGHDPGHIGVFVRTPSRQVLLAGDAVYSMRSIDELRLPGWLEDAEASWDTLHRLNRLTKLAPEVRIIPFHDPEVFRTIPSAPESL